MFSKKNRREIINTFFLQLFKKIFFWVILGLGLAILGGFFGNKDFISKDILGDSCQKIIGKSVEFNRFFLGSGLTERKKLLTFALMFLAVIIVFHILATLVNIFYRIKNKYIEDNEFYLYNRLIYFLYLLSRLFSYIVITLCFCSFQTLLWMITFISLYSWFWSRKGSNNPKTKNVFLWQDSNVWKILLCSSLVIFILPIFYSRFQKLFSSINQQEAQGGDVSELQKAIKNLFAAIPGLQIIIDLLANISSFAHWVILLLFARSVVFGSIKEFNNFWSDIGKINSQFKNFKIFYYYQKMLSKFNAEHSDDISAETKEEFLLGDYGFLMVVPNFLKRKRNLKQREDLKHFTGDILKVIESIDFIQIKLNPSGNDNYYQKEVNFIVFKIFNDKEQSLEKIEETKKIILS